MARSAGKSRRRSLAIKGTGSRFVYVIDRSESMAGFEFRPMLAAREQLWKSLSSLNENNQFQILFYNDEVKIFNGEPRLFFATGEAWNKRRALSSESGPAEGPTT